MATRVFKNRRQSQTFDPPANQSDPEPTAPAVTPSSIEEELPPPPKSSKQEERELLRKCQCGCGQFVRGRFVRGHSNRNKKIPTRPKDSGYGLWICGNCIWYRKPCPHSRTAEEGCKKDGLVNANSKPCRLMPTRHGGYFEPVKSPERIAEVDLSDWTSDELAFLQLKARLRLHVIQLSQIQGLRINQRVRYLVNGQLHRGAVIRLTKRHAVIIDDEGGEIRVRGEDVHPDDDPPAAGQSREFSS